MSSALIERIQNAVNEGRKIRSAYYAMIDLPDEQQLGPPASETDLVGLETWLGKPLPPSYRAFLSLHNGWRQVDGAMDLLSTEEIIKGPRHKIIQAWQAQLKKIGDFVAANSIVIGLSEVTATKLLLDPNRTNPQGEWTVVQHHNYEENNYPSFLVWLESSIDEFRQLIEEENL